MPRGFLRCADIDLNKMADQTMVMGTHLPMS